MEDEDSGEPRAVAQDIYRGFETWQQRRPRRLLLKLPVQRPQLPLRIINPRLRAAIKPQPPVPLNPKPKPRVPGPDEGTRGLFVFVLVAFRAVGSPGLSPPLRGRY